MERTLHRNIYFIAFAAAISGLLFGYDAGIISGAMIFIKKTFDISNIQIGEMVSAVPLGALISSVLTGKISDWLGRKKIILTTALLFSIGSLLCSFALNPIFLIAGRFLIGIAIGMSSTSSPVYIAEIAEKERRGKLVTLFLISINFGILLSYLINLLLANSASWRLMLGLGIIPALMLAIFTIYLPESPRWLLLTGKSKAAKDILEKIHGEKKAQTEFNEIQSILMCENNTSNFTLQKQFLKVLFLGGLIGVFTQAVGINAIIYYAPTIFLKTGFNKTITSMLATVGIGFAVTFSAVMAAKFIDKFGCRKLLLTGLSGIILSLCFIIYSFIYIKQPIMLGWSILIGFILFVVCQGLSVGPACFLLPAEIFPIKIRGVGMGISIAFNWLTNFLVALFFPIALAYYGTAFVFTIFLSLSVIGWIAFFLYVPNTKNISLENIEFNMLQNQKLRWIGQRIKT